VGDILAFSSLHVELSYFVSFELLLFFFFHVWLKLADIRIPRFIFSRQMFNGTLNEVHLLLCFQFIIHNNFLSQLCTLNSLKKSY
jgi:hypothetical protein